MTERPDRATTEPDPADESPRAGTRPSRWAVLKRTVQEFQGDNLTDWAAALTYYAVLALFPGVIVLVAVLGLAGTFPGTFNAVLEVVARVGPASAVETFAGPIESVVRDKGTAGTLLGFGLLGALWSASGYVGAFMRASNIVYEVKEGRPFWKLRPLQVLVTITMVLALTIVAIAVLLTGELAEAVGGVIGLGEVAVLVWSIAKWPLLVVIVSVMFSVLYHVAPNVRQPRFRWVTPGGLVAVVVWIAASVGFGVYVANFGSYDKTYGSLGGAIVFLVWLWISNVALLLGAELNAEVERARELEAGLPAERTLQLEPRVPAKE